MKKIFAIIALAVSALTINAEYTYQSADHMVYFAEGDMFYHKTYTHAKHDADCKVYMQLERGIAETNLAKCPVCYGFNK